MEIGAVRLARGSEDVDPGLVEMNCDLLFDDPDIVIVVAFDREIEIPRVGETGGFARRGRDMIERVDKIVGDVGQDRLGPALRASVDPQLGAMQAFGRG
ncbi:MAG: hypothetical protein AABZ73_06365 [Pseudomonadota bacterium]